MMRRLMALLLVFSLWSGLGAVAGTSVIAAQGDSGCVSGFGAKVPVLMVHGLNSDADIWNSRSSSAKSMRDILIDIPSSFPILFDYKSVAKEWVTHSQIGPELAKRIDCLSQNSRASGGLGKVIVLAHSMGGLAARYASAQTVNGRKVADSMGVITIGTPHLGSGLAEWCVNLEKVYVRPPQCEGPAVKALAPGSAELKALPQFASSIPVKSIVGDVTLVNRFLGVEYARLDTESDLVVPTVSAGHYSTGKSMGDGKRTFKCEGSSILPDNSDAFCEHSNMLKDTGVQAEVKQTIERFAEAWKNGAKKPELPSQSYTNIELFGRLVLPVPKTWGGGMSEPDMFGNFVDNSKCQASNAECPHIYVENLKADYFRELYGGRPVEAVASRQCGLQQPSAQVVAKLKATATVDGVEFRYYDEIICHTGLKSGVVTHIWHFPQKELLIVAYDYGGRLNLDEVKKVIASLSWK